ncbi:MAG TPA: hypothetical protein VMT89_18970 [Candidatus Acidoferrales bacterium]|nr:hypothetical protein [Candidatus Acidoferrales bacterium]
MKCALVVVALLLLSASAWAGDSVHLENVRTEWQNAYGAILYTVLADAKNSGATPVQYVKVKVELFDKNDKKVAERSGFNVGAEVLSDDASVSPEKLARVKPIPAGGSDLVRISLDKSDIGKPFRSAKVSVVEVR